MKKRTIVIILMLLVLVTVSPVINAQPLKQHDTTIKELDGNFKILKTIAINKLGYKKYNETYINISKIIDKELYVYSNGTLSDYDFTLFKDWCTIIISFSMLLFGHNQIGLCMGILLSMLLLCLPIALASLVVSVDEYRISILDYLNGFISDNIIEQFGLIGAFIIGILFFPVLFASFIILVPLFAIDMFLEMFKEIIMYGIDHAT